MVPPEPPAGADADDAAPPAAEAAAALVAALELSGDEDAAATGDEVDGPLDAEAPAVLDEEQAAREPATAMARHAVMTVPRAVEE